MSVKARGKVSHKHHQEGRVIPEMSEAQQSLARLSDGNSPPSVNFFAEIIAIAQIVVMGYNLVGRPNDAIPTALSKALGALEAVEQRVTAILTQIGELFKAIDLLEARIKGQLSYDRVKSAMISIGTKSNILRPLMVNEETFRRDLPRVINQMDELQDFIRQAQGFSNGLVAGAFNTGAGIALWTQTFTMVQRVRGDVQHTVWDEPFHQQNVQLFRDIFKIARELDPIYKGELADMDYPDTKTYRLSPPRFVDSGLPMAGRYYHEAKYNRLFSPGVREGKLRSTSPGRWQPPCGPQECPPSYPIYRWAETTDPYAKFEDPAMVQRATLQFGEVMMRKSVIDNFTELFKDMDKAEIQIEEVAVKPPEWELDGKKLSRKNLKPTRNPRVLGTT
ncbi:MAG TPA: hypothetical protein VF950_22535 [Planctomycetota bacterium]